VGFLVYLVLGPMLKVNLAHIFGVLTFFLNYIPNVGPVIATGELPVWRFVLHSPSEAASVCVP
jgi:predicted PurR-regulated permease PerM